MGQKRNLLFTAMMLFAVNPFNISAQQTLIPKPRIVERNQGVMKVKSFVLDSNGTDISSIMKSVDLPFGNKGIQVDLKLVSQLSGVEKANDEAYKLVINDQGVSVSATNEKGLYWGMQTLAQLYDEYERERLPYLEITDWPAFRVRGFMQDVGRSYISVEELKKEIETLAKYKVNVFHWHLTENQAWRLESKVHPEIVAAENMTRMKGKYYTIEEAKEIQAFCKEHNMLLLPEVDMPGHSAAFVRAFGVDMQSEKGMKILKDLVNEVCEIFDEVPYLHIGTDEVKFTNPTFCDDMVAFIRERGKKVISWNPGWRYKAGEIDMTQMWSYKGRPTPGVPAIDCKFHYLNHYDTFADIYGLYTSRVGNADQGDDQIAGAILAIWHDRFIDDESKNIKQNQLYPNMLALAERAWLGGGWQYFGDFGTKMEKGTEPFEAFTDFENRMVWHKDYNFRDLPFAYVKQTEVEWNISDAFPNDGDLAKSFEPETISKDNYTYGGKNYGVSSATGAGIYLRHVWGTSVPGFYKDPKENHTAYAWTYVYSPRKQKVGLWFETQNYSRSEKDLAPKQGKWDYRESKIWINQEEINPPAWTSVHTEKSNEITLGNENMVVRDPIEVTLKKGWNKVLIKLPIGKFSIPEVRLTKWMFAAAFVTKDGKKAAPGLIYSTTNPELPE